MYQSQSIPPFRPACADKFRERAPIFGDLVDYAQGALWRLINSEAAFIRMVVLTQAGMPAVAGLTHQLDPFLKPLDDRADFDEEAARLADRLRRGIGSMIREVMTTNGYEKEGRLRAVPPEPRRIFWRAEVYQLRLPEEPDPAPFDWDALAERTRYAELRRLSPELGSRRLPSMYSPDKRRYFITSLDVDVACSNEPALRYMLQELRRMWDVQVRTPWSQPLKLHTLRVDIGEVAGLLTKLVADPEEFENWEVELLESIRAAQVP